MYFNYRLLFVLMSVLNGFAFAGTELSALAKNAVEGKPEVSAVAIKSLRSKKQTGLDALFETYGSEIEDFKSTGKSSEKWIRLAFALDQVAMQKDAYSARLFWHTDLDAAIEEATARKKPILSLRLLGNLDDEYSCANSRLFRSILYSDPAVAKTLREDYVLHWKSVRPAPKITIDFGDGRKLVRTITGNSIHYILSSRGIIIDALPGLYDPETFQSYLKELRNFTGNRIPTITIEDTLKYSDANSYRLKKGYELVKNWEDRLALLGKDPANKDHDRVSTLPEPGNAMPAILRTASKSMIESPAVLALMPQIERLRENTELDDWKQVAAVGKPVLFSKESVALIRSKSGNISDDEFSQLINNLRNYVAIDTVQNEFRFHLTIMSWLSTLSSRDYEGFNQRVYSELFLTPDSDKWLGLYSPDIYSAIENNGVIR